ncbi:uncharacterized protein BYT42DRAFT_545097 [Radiomyces spectabilis]|uniref:uncharacterized protein n=1 Tax=Radiomyces spectabilis TaxID=64574 RepID=UPI00221E658D|nr:uncharacterized protein BYT42DRAFT_545097 [Radiomyces spectabilis]KAI8381162.1 hypothetical protein BYT42DRAFT_545097 [Radiomyces spectabilis]
MCQCCDVYIERVNLLGFFVSCIFFGDPVVIAAFSDFWCYIRRRYVDEYIRVRYEPPKDEVDLMRHPSVAEVMGSENLEPNEICQSVTVEKGPDKQSVVHVRKYIPAGNKGHSQPVTIGQHLGTNKRGIPDATMFHDVEDPMGSPSWNEQQPFGQILKSYRYPRIATLLHWILVYCFRISPNHQRLETHPHKPKINEPDTLKKGDNHNPESTSEPRTSVAGSSDTSNEHSFVSNEAKDTSTHDQHSHNASHLNDGIDRVHTAPSGSSTEKEPSVASDAWRPHLHSNRRQDTPTSEKENKALIKYSGRKQIFGMHKRSGSFQESSTQSPSRKRAQSTSLISDLIHKSYFRSPPTTSAPIPSIHEPDLRSSETGSRPYHHADTIAKTGDEKRNNTPQSEHHLYPHSYLETAAHPKMRNASTVPTTNLMPEEPPSVLTPRPVKHYVSERPITDRLTADLPVRISPSASPALSAVNYKGQTSTHRRPSSAPSSRQSSPLSDLSFQNVWIFNENEGFSEGVTTIHYISNWDRDNDKERIERFIEYWGIETMILKQAELSEQLIRYM